jgi:hypothetical protein
MWNIHIYTIQVVQMTGKDTRRSPIGLLTAKYIHDLSECESIRKRLDAEKKKIDASILSNEERRKRETIDYGSGLAGNFEDSKKPLALFTMLLFLKDGSNKGTASPEKGSLLTAGQIFDDGSLRFAKRFWLDKEKLRKDIVDTLGYLKENGFVKSDVEFNNAQFDAGMTVELTGNGVLAIEALKAYITDKSRLKR